MNNDTFIFIGPTITVDEAKQHLDATYLPPVKYGDVYRITELYQPKIIGVIDGYFNQVPAVWHKEILWAINQGVKVYGAASMGALRAAELEPLGMIGCGKIFEAFQQGVMLPYVDEAFEDDDEVAVVLGPPELGYKALSDAMVNIRATLAKAHQQNVIDLQTRTKFINIAKNEFYPDRTYENLLAAAKQQDIATEQIQSLRTWIVENQIDQKKEDAINLLNLIQQHGLSQKKDLRETSATPFQHTSQWQSAVNEIDQSHRLEHVALDELRLKGEEYFRQMDEAANLIFTSEFEAQTYRHDDLSNFHQQPNELDQQFKVDWQQRSKNFTYEQFSASERDHILVNRLRMASRLDALQQRADHKQSTLSQIKVPDAHELSELDLLQLADWYFTQNLQLNLPDQLEHYAGQLGFTDMDDFYAMILKEYYYLEYNITDDEQKPTNHNP